MESGARIERGTVREASGRAYTVASIDREGIVSLPIGTVSGTKHEAGDMVYFFLFPDGTGKIICGL